jgi:hypothetical protein
VVLWWIGNLLLLFAVIPLVLYLADGLLRATLEIRRYADDVLDHGVSLTSTLDAVPRLVTTAELAGTARGLVGRYGAALRRLL